MKGGVKRKRDEPARRKGKREDERMKEDAADRALQPAGFILCRGILCMIVRL